MGLSDEQPIQGIYSLVLEQPIYPEHVFGVCQAMGIGECVLEGNSYKHHGFIYERGIFRECDEGWWVPVKEGSYVSPVDKIARLCFSSEEDKNDFLEKYKEERASGKYIPTIEKIRMILERRAERASGL